MIAQRGLDLVGTQLAEDERCGLSLPGVGDPLVTLRTVAHVLYGHSLLFRNAHLDYRHISDLTGGQLAPSQSALRYRVHARVQRVPNHSVPVPDTLSFLCSSRVRMGGKSGTHAMPTENGSALRRPKAPVACVVCKSRRIRVSTSLESSGGNRKTSDGPSIVLRDGALSSLHCAEYGMYH